jgi:hypothetical protein
MRDCLFNCSPRNENFNLLVRFNIPPVATSDSITYFFENKGKSGGGDIDVMDYDKESQAAIITFKEEEGWYFSN